MTDASRLPPRQLACARCGATFECRLGGGCWCNDESVKLPLPAIGGEDCLCPACLRKAAEAQQQQQQ
ncbi:hypothetical protein DW352_23905 [Pseudolabrys taiwanensis]|uniref:Cysteine-rich CWC family protein n=1 Tax=Pseudolabrys taiwanensis TaxID=331696 RepID=A0A346A297_9HYPH|nr:cysteine-rich CWC family protein [Pseudolabrys taiwanensis]AXK83294.1 hypothetical protein DW352_23905 [Pseudolabrys taiwanensis]